MSQVHEVPDGVMRDPYQEWIANEKIPVHRDFAVDLRSVEVGDWPRWGIRGAAIQVAGRGPFLDLWLLEIPPGGATAPQRHLFEAVAYVICGRGNTVIGGEQSGRSFEWGERATFAVPLNTTYQIFNASGTEPCRIALITSFPIVMDLFHSESLIFDLDVDIPDRDSRMGFDGQGTHSAYDGGGFQINLWETNFVPDLGAFAELRPLEFRGKGSMNIIFLLADGTMHAHISEIPTGNYKKAHRHPAGFHIFPVTGHGYSLLWFEGESTRRRVDWEHGWVYAPPDEMFHQHFNLEVHPSRYFAVALGSKRYPFLTREFSSQGVQETADGGNQIEYADEDPEIRSLYESELSAARARE